MTSLSLRALGRALGRDGPKVNSIGFGAMSIGGVYGPAGTDKERFELLDRAHELGNTFWDTADMYADSEDVIGKWFKKTGKRNDIFLATKFGLVPEDGRLVIKSFPGFVKAACYTRLRSDTGSTLTACERSLARLGVDVIDLYYCHRVDGKTPIEKTIEAMVESKKQGKIKYLGLSEVSSQTLRRAHAVHPISALQIEYSPFALDIEDPKIGLLETCRELGIAIVAYSPMGRGLLTGVKTYQDVAADPFLSTLPKMSKENFPKILELVDKIKDLAKKKGCTPAQLTLTWVMAQGDDDFIPIPGTRKPKYLEENFKAQEVVLGREEVQELREAANRTQVPGARYPEAFVPFVLGDTPAL